MSRNVRNLKISTVKKNTGLNLKNSSLVIDFDTVEVNYFEYKLNKNLNIR